MYMLYYIYIREAVLCYKFALTFSKVSLTNSLWAIMRGSLGC